MSQKRKSSSENEILVLVTQVDSLCPKCGKALIYLKNSRLFKDFQIAHIYPLNPSAQEVELLRDEERLSSDVNSIENLIPLCPSCHTQFDKPRTVEEYRELVQIKKDATTRHAARLTYRNNHIDEAIHTLVHNISPDPLDLVNIELNYSVQSLPAKLGNDFPGVTHRKIQHNVTDYFVSIRDRLIRLEKEEPGITDTLSLQVRGFYIARKRANNTKEETFQLVVDWMTHLLLDLSVDEAEILASFFIQNCEVFE